MIAGPDTAVGMLRVRKVWRTGLSDHALVYTDPTTNASTRRTDVLTPWAYKALPPESHQDLRRRFRSLELLFDMPAVDLTELPLPSDWTGPRRPGETAHDDAHEDQVLTLDQEEPEPSNDMHSQGLPQPQMRSFANLSWPSLPYTDAVHLAPRSSLGGRAGAVKPS